MKKVVLQESNKEVNALQLLHGVGRNPKLHKRWRYSANYYQKITFLRKSKKLRIHSIESPNDAYRIL